MSHRNYAIPALLVAASSLGVLASWFGAPIFPFGLCGYIVLVLVPGAAAFHLASKEYTLLEHLTAAIALSPVLTAAVTALLMLAGVPEREMTTLVLVFACVLGVVAFLRPRTRRRALDRRQTLALLALLAIAAAVIAYLPLTREWWRMRSDAWFHAAVIAQIADYGLPPEDPYMAGIPLQYMWLYHVLALGLSAASGIGRFMVMTLLNVQALVGFGLAAFLFSSIFRKTFSHNFAAVLTVFFGMNAAFWLFIPLKMLRVFTGEVRGTEEVSRQFSLRPFDVVTVRRFVHVGNVQEFLLDKFMVSTAFSLALMLMAALWWGAAKYVISGERKYLVACFLAAFGVVSFHAALGVIAFTAVVAGLVLLIALRRYLNGYDTRPILTLLFVLVVCGILLLPYLYSITYAKTGDAAVPLGLSWAKMLGIVMSCALVIFLASFQCRRIFRGTDLATYFLIWTTAVVVILCAVIQLPAANVHDKLPFLPFFPLAVVGGWTIAEFSERAPSARGRNARFLVAGLLAFGPLNIFMLAGYYNTTSYLAMSPAEAGVAAWFREETPRDSVIIDTATSRFFLLIAGPRRYYMASETFAAGWGYDGNEIRRRKQLITDLYTPEEVDSLTLNTLRHMTYPLYIIVRSDGGIAESKEFDRHPTLYRRAFTHGPIAVFEVNRNANLESAHDSG